MEEAGVDSSDCLGIGITNQRETTVVWDRKSGKAVHRAIEALQRLSELFLGRRRQLAREAGLTESQWRLLEELADEDFMPSLFARRRDCTPTSSPWMRPIG